jgi:hypothetical protein
MGHEIEPRNANVEDFRGSAWWWGELANYVYLTCGRFLEEGEDCEELWTCGYSGLEVSAESAKKIGEHLLKIVDSGVIKGRYQYPCATKLDDEKFREFAVFCIISGGFKIV